MDIRQVAIIGLGTVGAGIAEALACGGSGRGFYSYGEKGPAHRASPAISQNEKDGAAPATVTLLDAGAAAAGLAFRG